MVYCLFPLVFATREYFINNFINKVYAEGQALVEVKSEKLTKIERIISQAKAVQLLVVAFNKKQGAIMGWEKKLADFIQSAESIRNNAILGAYRRAVKEVTED